MLCCVVLCVVLLNKHICRKKSCFYWIKVQLVVYEDIDWFYPINPHWCVAVGVVVGVVLGVVFCCTIIANRRPINLELLYQECCIMVVVLCCVVELS